MSKINFKPGNMLYPVPAVMVSCGDIHDVSNILTIAWAGTICTNPPMLSISVRPERFSYELIKKEQAFVVNLTTERLAQAVDFCGVRSGRQINKWDACHLTPQPAQTVPCPLIAQSPVNIECQVTQTLELGSHHMFIANVTAVHVDDTLLDLQGSLQLEQSGLLAYSHGKYFSLKKQLGYFGYSVARKKRAKKHNSKKIL
jgi:flavin reductase (DIM6/NTAB) family NADH-FMN oxidoreductase RutF